MRVIIEVDSAEELQEILPFLENKTVELRQPMLSRQERLERIFDRYQGHLPEDYRFNRDEAHDR